MSCDLFIRSYWKDFEWLEFSLASIVKYCHSFRSVIVVVPQSSQSWVKRCQVPEGVQIKLCRDYKDDYLGQQATKLLADTFTSADYICHIDSDCIFFRSICPHDLIIDGKPVVRTLPCELLGRHRPWQQPTEKFLGCPVTKDFMQQPPFTFPRWLYPLLRDHAIATHRVDIETYITAQPPRAFSEYNALSAFAWQRYRDHFIWIDTNESPLGEPQCLWYWSWGGISPAIRSEIISILDTANDGTSSS